MAKEQTIACDNSPNADDVAYILKFEHAPLTNGVRRYVDFVKGWGVLDNRALASHRSDLCDQLTLELKPTSEGVMQSIADYFERGGCTVTKTTAIKAMAFRRELEKRRHGTIEPAVPTPAPSAGGDETIKVSDLTKELRAIGSTLGNKEVLDMLRTNGIEAKAHNSKVPAAEARAVFAKVTPDGDGADNDSGNSVDVADNSAAAMRAPHEQ